MVNTGNRTGCSHDTVGQDGAVIRGILSKSRHQKTVGSKRACGGRKTARSGDAFPADPPEMTCSFFPVPEENHARLLSQRPAEGEDRDRRPQLFLLPREGMRRKMFLPDCQADTFRCINPWTTSQMQRGDRRNEFHE